MRTLLPLLLLAGCGGGKDKDDRRQPAPPRTMWELGPTIDGKNFSVGSVQGDTITGGDLHYITRATGPLSGTVTVQFSIDAIPTSDPKCEGGPATASLYFQEAGDDWATDGKRWWTATTTLDRIGEYTLTAPFDGPWRSVMAKNSDNAPADFVRAKAKANRVGFTIGDCTGLGHGGYGPVNLTIQNFAINGG